MKVIFGAIITNGIGSIGGQFIKRVKNGHSFNNKPARSSLAKLNVNNRLAQLAYIFKLWSGFSQEVRDAWSDNALTIQFPDKFGMNKYLTGRQFFIKMQAQNIFYSLDVLDPLDWTADLPAGMGVYNSSSLFNEQLMIGIEDWAGIGVIYVRIDKRSSGAIENSFINSAIVEQFLPDMPTEFNMWGALISKYPLVQAGDWYQMSFVFANFQGMVANPQVINFEIGA